MSDYINTIYNDESRPLNSYPGKLAKYIFSNFNLKANDKFLEPGFGRGEFLNEFKKLGLDCYGIDISDTAGDLFKGNLKIKTGINVEQDTWPFPDNYFDCIYSKSLMEHLQDPQKYLNEAKRVLKPGGKILCFIPDWEANYQIYFDDHTHVKPFTKISLRDILRMTDFKSIKVYRFRQLPITWKYPFMNIISYLVSFFVPHRSKIKFLRWSKELMLIGYAIK